MIVTTVCKILCLLFFGQITAGSRPRIDFLCTCALCLFMVQIDKGSCRIRRHRLREEIPLRRGAAPGPQSSTLSKCLSSLRDNLQPEISAERPYRPHNGTILPSPLHT